MAHAQVTLVSEAPKNAHSHHTDLDKARLLHSPCPATVTGLLGRVCSGPSLILIDRGSGALGWAGHSRVQAKGPGSISSTLSKASRASSHTDVSAVCHSPSERSKELGTGGHVWPRSFPSSGTGTHMASSMGRGGGFWVQLGPLHVCAPQWAPLRETEAHRYKPDLTQGR